MNPTNENNASLTAAKRPRIAYLVMVVGASIVLLVPTADNYRDTRASRIALEDANVSQRTGGDLRRLRLQLTKMQAAHQQWENRSVRPERALEFQNELVAIARSLKCRVRHASLGLPHRKPWSADDDPFADASWAVNRPNTASRAAAHYVVIQSMDLTLEGSFEDCQKFVTTLQDKRRLIGVKSLEFHPTNSNPELLQLDIELLMFTLEAPTPGTRADRVGA